MKASTKFLKMIIATVIFTTGALSGFYIPNEIIKNQIEKQATQYFIEKDFSMPFQTFTTFTFESLIGNAAPWAKKHLDEKVSKNLESLVREKYAYRYQAAIKGLKSEADIVSYLKQTGIINEINLSEHAALKKLMELDLSSTVMIAKSPYTMAYMNTAPDMSVRLPAEFEPIESVFVSFPILYPSQWKTHLALIDAITEEAVAVVLVPDEFWHKSVMLYLQQIGLDLNNIRFAYVKSDDVWTRDYGPTNVIMGDGSKAFIWNHYYEEYTSFAKLSTDAASELGRYYNLPVYRVPLVVEGGNIISDGKGTIIMFDSVLNNNPDYDIDKLRDVMKMYYGCTNLILLPELNGELTGHIDMVVKYIDRETLMVIESEKSYKWYQYFENIAEKLSKEKSTSGKAYKVVRMKMASPGDDPERFWSYINSLTVNNSVIVPIFGQKEDSAALELYTKAMPGYRIIGINFSNYPVGSVHCQTKEMYK